MRNRTIAILTVLVLTCCTAAGCGNAAKPAADAGSTEAVKEEAAPEKAPETAKEETATEKTAEETAATEEENTAIGNPWVDITSEEAHEIVPRLFKAPEGAKDEGWMKCEDLGDSDKGIGPMVQLSFILDDLPFTARAQVGAPEDTDIGGNYVEWTYGPEEVTLANWGGGNMKGKMRRSINDSGYVDELTWYDVEIGILYSLSTASDDLDGFDIQAVVEQMYDGGSEPYEEVAEDFVQEQSGKTSFESYDEVIAALTKGQGYAYIKLTGSDEDILAVTDLVFEADHSAYDVSLYGKMDGKVKWLGLASGNGSAYPLRLADGILYGGDNHSYFTYFLTSDGALMYKDSIEDGVNSGSNEFSGFTRETNTFDSKDFTGGQEEFDKLLAEREKKPLIEFKVAE